MSLAQLEFPAIDVAVCVDSLTGASNLSIGELAFVTASITQEEHTLAFLCAVDILSLVLEVWVLECVYSLTMTKLGDWV
jgi:hypothetical protein